ncbi:MAG TPA: hypothetical protein VHG89_10155 [Verrucomicrobiae bacterium]|nr:hypothetical protein [Verrucomicrobiae bacterium]
MSRYGKKSSNKAIRYIKPHAYMVNRTMDDYERMALAGCEAVGCMEFWQVAYFLA